METNGFFVNMKLMDGDFLLKNSVNKVILLEIKDMRSARVIETTSSAPKEFL